MMRNKVNKQGDAHAGEIERWASILGGSAVALYGLSRRSTGGIALVLAGGGLLYLGTTPYRPVSSVLGRYRDARRGQAATLTAEASVTVDRPPAEAYHVWRHFENLPRFMTHLDTVTTSSNGRSHWVAKAPLLGSPTAWDVEIINEYEDKLIAWRSLSEAAVPAAGFVRFGTPAEGGGTVVTATLEYRTPVEGVGAAATSLFQHEPQRQVEEAMRRFKELMESGTLPIPEGQPSTRGEGVGDAFVKQRDAQRGVSTDDAVQESSEGSFPASDPPAWTGSAEPDAL